MKKIQNEYDDIKGFLNKIRRIQAKSDNYGVIKEQIDDTEKNVDIEQSIDDDDYVQDPTIKDTPGEGEETDIAVINNVEIEIHSEDPEDLELQEEEKKIISQLIDDFRDEVSEIAEFDKLHIYDERSAKLDGKITDIGINFTFSTGDDIGLYISNISMLKIDDKSLDMINKLRSFEPKFVNSINNLILNRSST